MAKGLGAISLAILLASTKDTFDRRTDLLVGAMDATNPAARSALTFL